MKITSVRSRLWVRVFGGSLASLAFLAVSLLLSTNSAAVSRPNVLLIMSDDQGWGDIHSHNNDLVDTPRLDHLAEEGARFDRFYVSPVCAPTRASLLTGRYYLRTGVHGVTRGYETMRSEEITIGEIFKTAGYVTGCFGKWHNGAHYPHHPNGQGFDEFVGFCGGHWNNYFDTQLEHNGKLQKTKGFITDVLTDAAVKFIEDNRAGPFLCYVPFNAPHSPWQVPEEFYGEYKAKGMSDTLACAYGMVENLDRNIGRLLEKLEELELESRTIVVFLTDNGPNTDRYNGGMKGRKGSLHEGGVRVPLFIRWPGRIQPGLKVEQIAAHIDLLPTLMDLCGLFPQATPPLDGMSLLPLLTGKKIEWPDRMLFSGWGGSEVAPGRGAVRTQRWRAVKYEEWELYDMWSDPGQEKNIARQHPNLVRDFDCAYNRWFQGVTREGFDPIPIPIGYPEQLQTVLPGHEAFLFPAVGEGISYNGRAGYANDWIDNWRRTEAYPYWEVDVIRAGAYQVTLMYVCSEENVGSRVRVEISGQSVEGVVESAHDPEPIPSPDRVRRLEVYEKVWAPLEVGRVMLPAGRSRLIVRALSKEGEEVLDLKSVMLRPVD